MTDTITATLATIPEREGALRNVVEALGPQVDHLIVYLNGYDEAPQWLQQHKERTFVQLGVDYQVGEDLGDAGKFVEPWPGYHLVCDDDLHYPTDYAARMIEGVKRYGREAVVTLHGKRYDERPIRSFCRDFTTNCRCLDAVEEDTAVHIPGTGVMAYHTDTIRFHAENFREPGMADVWAGLKCQRAGVPVVCLAHEAGFVRALPTEGETLWRKATRDDTKQTELINGVEWS